MYDFGPADKNDLIDEPYLVISTIANPGKMAEKLASPEISYWETAQSAKENYSGLLSLALHRPRSLSKLYLTRCLLRNRKSGSKLSKSIDG